MSEPVPGTLNLGEYHPSAPSALRYIQGLGLLRLSILSESFASCALSGNRSSEICSETLSRIMRGDPVSDRYVLGLAWMIKSMEENWNTNDDQSPASPQTGG